MVIKSRQTLRSDNQGALKSTLDPTIEFVAHHVIPSKAAAEVTLLL